MDEQDTTPADAPETPATEPTATERLTGKATKPKAAKGKPKATAKADADDEHGDDGHEAGTLFRVHVPADPCLPPREVRGATAADAKEKYLSELGVITCGHPVQAQPLD